MRLGLPRTLAAFGLAALAASLGPASASALTLADLVAGESFSQDGVSYEGFRVKVLGRGLSRELSRYEVVPGPCGFQIGGDAATGNGGDGRLRIRYDVSSSEEGGVVLTSVGVFSGENPDTMVKNKRRLYEGSKLLGTLFAKPMPGMDTVQLELDGAGSLRVVDTIRVWGRFADGANVTSRYFTEDCVVPEPGTALLLAAGLLGLAGVQRRAIAALRRSALRS
jgi:PEP-CTERM motif